MFYKTCHLNLLENAAFRKCLWDTLRNYHHVRPVIKYNITKPEVDLTKHDPNNEFSPLVREFIQARDFENSGSCRKIGVISLQDGKWKGDVELNNFVFGTNPRIDILHRNVVWYRASIRAGTASVKRRSEVRGGGRKPWQQKGTGKARQGSIRAPHWRKGGSAKGPKPRDWSYDLPYKVRRMGLRCALSSRLSQGDLTVVEELSNLPASDHDLTKLLTEHGLQNSLIVDGFENLKLNELTEPIEKVDATQALFLHVYGILRRHKLVLSLQALRLLEEKLAEDGRMITDPNYELYKEDMLLDKNLLYKEYDPKTKTLRGTLIPVPKKLDRRSLSFSRKDLKR